MSDNGLIKLGGLWKKEKGGKVFFSGRLGYGANLLLFRNDHKRDDRDPDLVLYVARAEKKEKPVTQTSEEENEVPF